MYEALNVRDVDKILLPPSTTEEVPKDAAQENIDTFSGTPLTAFEEQDHQAHIMAHMVFGASPMVAQIPRIAMDLQKHIMQHVQIQATEQAKEVYQQQTNSAPQMQGDLVFEALKSQFIAEGMQGLNLQIHQNQPLIPTLKDKAKCLILKRLSLTVLTQWMVLLQKVNPEAWVGPYVVANLLFVKCL